MSNRDGAEPAPTTQPPVELRTEEPHPARVYDYLLGGKDNFQADREAADRSLARFPHANTPVWLAGSAVHRVGSHHDG